MRTRLSLLVLGLIALISSPFAANNNLKEIEQDLTDSVITTKVTAKFARAKELNLLKVFVTTEDGIVHLSGNVKDRQSFVEALRLAKNTRGVVAVDTEALEIREVNTALTDAYITARVQTAVLKAKVLDDETIPLVGINATTSNGVVTLSGVVDNSRAVASILKRVHAIRGVKKIVSHLSVGKADA
ncbi:osmotically inducible protein Y [Legionella geestiana]|uniref:Osmotically inducible protein Y n=1 Tax=Legionella geestiana TaxID=45065 RepID=A0A0W0TT33_9GAMM|nr:BON domain-containing protein [Legionella geestiana]KTC98804.1 osmotically inducible protein Y [Legionella geestiana]QBS12808.1 BON domain-containing protein [Legionella geestiana]QDQ39475.1 BON domain-containing protein [Legionella geestiana]STX54712.1 osmotically inducible protein Y [Legionella geestiana]